MKIIDRLNHKEKKAIEELQVRMKGTLPPNLCDDASLYYRFLKARDFDLDKAEKMLLKHISWRKAYQVDTLLDDFKPREFFKYVEPTLLGYGKEGEMILHCATGKLEIADTLKCVKMNEYLKTWIWYTEKNLKLLKEQSQKTGKDCTQITFIFDLDQLTLSNVSDKSNADLWLRLTHLFQDNYPERLKSVYVINAPSYYVLIYSILKAAMSTAMTRKIHVFSQTGYQDKLLELIDADHLPKFLGGNRTDPDGNPLCTSYVSHGGKIPSIYYLSEEDRYFKDRSRVKKVVIPKKGREEISIDVTENGSLIQWEFLVKNKDVGFGITLQISEQNAIDVLPVERFSTPDGTETGSYKCLTAGKYNIIFENFHSWLNSREVEYCVTVTKPQ